jgi:hypothetical protein
MNPLDRIVHHHEKYFHVIGSERSCSVCDLILMVRQLQKELAAWKNAYRNSIPETQHVESHMAMMEDRIEHE